MFPPFSETAKNLKLGKYRHFKGGEYQVLGVGHHSETGEEMVIYQETYNNHQLCVRPLAMFVEEVERDEYKGPRFAYVEEN